jgi:hypothetical protein
MSVFKGSPLGELARIRNVTTGRVSSWDRTGGNMDFLVVQAGAKRSRWPTSRAPAASITSGVHTPVNNRLSAPAWCCAHAGTMKSDFSIETPLGDFFGMGHAQTVNFSSLPLQMSPPDGRGFNCWFPMPFGSRAEFFLRNEADVNDEFLLLHRLRTARFDPR